MKILLNVFIITFCLLGVSVAYSQTVPGHQPLVSAYGKGLCNLPGFKCIEVGRKKDWKELFPDRLKREIVKRLNRTNVSLYYSKTLIVPKSWKNLNYMSLSPFPAHRDTQGKKLLLVDLRVFAFGAYDANGNLVFWGPASGGKSWCKDLDRSCATAAGRFHIYRIQGADCTSSEYPIDKDGGASMPYCMHYYRGFAIHGSTLSGFRNRSRGCVRLFDDDAKWLNEYFVKKGTDVIVIR